MEANIILTALNLILFILQITMFYNMCSRINTLNYNDKKALEQYQKYKDAEREKLAAHLQLLRIIAQRSRCWTRPKISPGFWQRKGVSP